MINVAGLVDDSFVDGDGIRFTIFEQGCTHNCKGCHNPETHKFVDKKLYTVDELFNKITENPLLDGVTFSGGDPFFQAKENIELISKIKEKTDLTVWAYTGYTWEEFFNYELFKEQPKLKSPINQYMIDMLKLCDVIVDGKYDENCKTLDCTYVGSSNQRIINVQNSLGNKIPTTLNF